MIWWLVPSSSLPSATISYGDCLVHMHFECKGSYSSAPVDFNWTHFEKRFIWHNISHSAWLWGWRASNLDKTVSLNGMYVWGVNSKVTNNSDYFVWKDMSERVARHCDNTAGKKPVNSCVLKTLLTNSQKKNGNALSDALIMSSFQTASFLIMSRFQTARFFETATSFLKPRHELWWQIQICFWIKAYGCPW